MTISDLKKKEGGLAGIVAADSHICLCDADDESLLYRGYSIEDLGLKSSFEETAWLLLRGKLPSSYELELYKKKLKGTRTLPETLKKVLECLPRSSNPMDNLRIGCSTLGCIEPEKVQLGGAPTPKEIKSTLEIADRLLAVIPSMLMYSYHYQTTGSVLWHDTDEETTAGWILHQLSGQKPSEYERRALDISLILYAEHEFNASTFTVRTIASTLSDIYSCICGGIGALKGALHGGANEYALRLILSFDSPESAEAGILERLKNKELIMGFGHRVYTKSDPRSKIIKNVAKNLAKTADQKQLFEIAERIEEVMWREKKLFPNLDFYSSVVYSYLNIPFELFTPLFALARTAGWSAHILEQRSSNKIIRPISHYVGEKKRAYVPIDERG